LRQHIRKRTTKAGSVSTTLIEAYRDKRGRPRQHVLANLYGEQNTLRALVKLVLKHDALLEQREEEHAEPSKRGANFVLVTEHMAHIDRQLAAIERDIAAISEHCTASEDEFQEAVQRYKEECGRALEKALGLAMASKQANAAVRKLI
jgi:hypothetical protein